MGCPWRWSPRPCLALLAEIGFACLGVLLAGAADARTFVVRVDGTGDAPTVQAALDSIVARYPESGQSITLEPGTYDEDARLTGLVRGDMGITAHGGPGVTRLRSLYLLHSPGSSTVSVKGLAFLDSVTVLQLPTAFDDCRFEGNVRYDVRTLSAYWLTYTMFRHCAFMERFSFDHQGFIDSCRFEGPTVFHAFDWDLTLSGCTFAGQDTAATIRAGPYSVNFNRCSFSQVDEGVFGRSDYPYGFLPVRVDRCRFVDVKGTAIGLEARGGIRLTVANTSFERCGSALKVKSDYRADINMSADTIKQSGISSVEASASGGSLRLNDLLVHGSDDAGLKVSGFEELNLRGCRFEANGGPGVELSGGVVVAQGNVFAKNGSAGFVRNAVGSQQPDSLTGNTSVLNGGPGMVARGPAEGAAWLVIENNLLAGNGAEGLLIDGPFVGTIRNNNAWANRGLPYRKTEGDAANETSPQLLSIWGSPLGFSGSRGICVDDQGFVYVADGWHIQKLDSAGHFLAAWEVPGPAPGTAGSPWNVTVNSDGEIYAADISYDRIVKFDAEGVYLGAWGGTGSAPGALDFPSALAVAPNGHVYVADRNNRRVEEFTGDGVFLREWSIAGTVGEPVGIGSDATGTIYVEGYGNIALFSPDGELISSFNLGEGDWAPGGMSVTPAGDVYVSDLIESTVAQFTPTGDLITEWGGNGTTGGYFQQPTGIATDAEEKIYVVDSGNGRIQVFGAGRPALGANLEVDPQFCNALADDFHVAASSPCAPSGLYGQIGAFGVGCDAMTVPLDVQSHAINLRSNAPVEAAILGHRLFDPRRVDPSTVRLAGASPSPRGRASPQMRDVNQDGLADLLLSFNARDLRIEGGEARLEGRTLDGAPFRGSDAVEVRSASRASLEEGVPASIRLALSVTQAHGGLSLLLDLPSPEAASIEVFDVAGRRVLSKDLCGFEPGRHRLAIEERLASGLYLLRLRQGTETVVARALVLH